MSLLPHLLFFISFIVSSFKSPGTLNHERNPPTSSPHMSHWGQWRSGSNRWHHWGPWSSRALLEQCNQTSSNSSRPYRCACASLGEVCRGKRQQSEGPMLSPTSLSSDCLLLPVLLLSEVIHTKHFWLKVLRLWRKSMYTFQMLELTDSLTFFR